MGLSANVRGALLQLAAMGLYATHDAVIKTLGARYPAFQILFFSSLLSFPLISMVLMRDRTHGTLRPNRPGWIALRTACAVASGMAGFYAFSNLPLAQVYAILFATPLLITILSIPVLGERVGAHRWAAVIVGLIGVLIVLRPGGQTLAPGHGAALIAALASGLAAVIIRKLGGTERPVVLIMWPMLGNFVVTGGALSLGYTPMALPDLALAGLIAGLGLAGGFLVILAYRAGEAAIVAPMQYSQILWATGYGWFLFGEVLDLPTLIGAAIIIGSGLYIVWREGRGGNSANRPVLATRLRTETVTAPKSAILQRLWHPRD
ncbi:MAG: DMT family transporter [Paracoccus sp. (in: a-proteobacteria)]|uniref:DMT family transporter n=1 Tax=unclassified Paracoccus (in: a-proteobacteria) TaxID=2688777 RepID=UPI002331886E|nr:MULTISPECIES: DMT family transporter [unclassified Paracoccus (in: a-proteobacteria)]MCS5602361.1 DMT family transporter [Paracoccus sp. (in: a-proteobacteria)]MDB2490518.1 DMT family transporter [Paracoccus sp. (in: a-proteobacteria)]MDB2551517.1 DMT family transporter [Paracoccus sp. (in: a-proteobacteria)]